MNMLELFVIFFVALLVIKPERLPEITYMLGRWLGQIQRWYHNTFKTHFPL